MSSQLENLDFADDLAMISTTAKQIQEKTDRLIRYGRQVGLDINSTKPQVMHINPKRNDAINVEETPLEYVDEFTQLGSIISRDNGAQKDTRAILGKARTVFADYGPYGSQASTT